MTKAEHLLQESMVFKTLLFFLKCTKFCLLSVILKPEPHQGLMETITQDWGKSLMFTASASKSSCKYTIVERWSNIIFSGLRKQWCVAKYFELFACLRRNLFQDLITLTQTTFSSLSPFNSISCVSNLVCITYFCSTFLSKTMWKSQVI